MSLLKNGPVFATKSNAKELTCKGRIYRCRDTQYITSRGWSSSVSMSFLKKKSCPGCDQCGYLEDDLHESSCERLVDIKPRVQDQALYQLMIVDISTDWETGYVDDWSVAFILIEEENKK